MVKIGVEINRNFLCPVGVLRYLINEINDRSRLDPFLGNPEYLRADLLI
jgi:hypothetical protein